MAISCLHKRFLRVGIRRDTFLEITRSVNYLAVDMICDPLRFFLEKAKNGKIDYWNYFHITTAIDFLWQVLHFTKGRLISQQLIIGGCKRNCVLWKITKIRSLTHYPLCWPVGFPTADFIDKTFLLCLYLSRLLHTIKDMMVRSTKYSVAELYKGSHYNLFKRFEMSCECTHVSTAQCNALEAQARWARRVSHCADVYCPVAQNKDEKPNAWTATTYNPTGRPRRQIRSHRLF